MAWTTYKEKIKQLSEAIVEAQKPIKVLDAIKWDQKVDAEFFARKGRELPKIDAAYYQQNNPLGFDPKAKIEELKGLHQKVTATLGADDDIGKLLISMVQEYQIVVDMLANRGTKQFYERSKELYGSPKDRFLDDNNTILTLGRLLYTILQNLEGKELGIEYPKDIPADQAVKLLQDRFDKSFLNGRVEVKLSDGIVSDAAAGNDVIKLKEGTLFSRKDIDIFEVHEGYVHVATTANGKSQKIAKWLAKGPPRCVATQEGLAILMEIFTFSTYPRRARSINDRILAVDKAEDGANFLDIYEFNLTEGYTETESFRNAMRVFRGGSTSGGAPFTKDISYCRGYIENYNFIRTAIRKGKPELIPFLFVGKLNVEDVPLLWQKHKEGVVDAPMLLPPQFQDLNGLAVWMSFSNFFNTVNLSKVQDHYDSLFRKYV